jgi:tetratricopeptide (TPR) repeat protein
VKTYATMGDEAKAAEYQSRLEQRQQSATDKPDENGLTEIERYQQQLAEARKQRDRRGEMNAHKALENKYSNLRDYQRAVSHSDAGLQIAKDINDYESVLDFALSTGRYYSWLFDWKKALASYRQGIEYPQQHPSREFAQLLHEAGDIYRRFGNQTQALEFYQQSFVLRSQMDDDGNPPSAP